MLETKLDVSDSDKTVCSVGLLQLLARTPTLTAGGR